MFIRLLSEHYQINKSMLTLVVDGSKDPRAVVCMNKHVGNAVTNLRLDSMRRAATACQTITDPRKGLSSWTANDF
eukprot:scaffold30333_cov19-Prasinocladus_malaysianus.AAC.1